MTTLIVGCSGGIGSAIVGALVARGEQVIGIDIARPPLNDLIATFYQADLRNTAMVIDVCSSIKQRVTSLWSIVYCAGIYNPQIPLDEYPISTWDDEHSVNVRGAFLVCSILHPIIESGGRIVTVVSGSAHVGSRDVGYSASKAALLGLTKSLALNLSPRGILVNAVCPGPIESQMSARMPEGRVSEYKDRILLRRFGRPQEVASAVDFLLSPSTAYITGATIDVNGGLYLR